MRGENRAAGHSKMAPEELDRVIDDIMMAERSVSPPIDLACKVHEQIRLQTAIRRERRRLFRRIVITWGSAAACVTLLAFLFVWGDVWDRTLGMVPGGMGYADGVWTRAWHDTSLTGLGALLAASGVVLGMLALLGSAVGFGSGDRPQRPA